MAQFSYSLLYNESKSLYNKDGIETANYEFPYNPRGYVSGDTIEEACEKFKKRFNHLSNGDWEIELFNRDDYAKVSFANEEDLLSIVFELDLSY